VLHKDLSFPGKDLEYSGFVLCSLHEDDVFDGCFGIFCEIVNLTELVLETYARYCSRFMFLFSPPSECKSCISTSMEGIRIDIIAH